MRTLTCPACGQVHEEATERCLLCGAAMQALSPDSPEVDLRGGSLAASLKTRWVAAVIAFWVSVAVLGIVSVLNGRLNLILVSICLGLLIVGMWLKLRYQRQLRKDSE